MIDRPYPPPQVSLEALMADTRRFTQLYAHALDELAAGNREPLHALAQECRLRRQTREDVPRAD